MGDRYIIEIVCPKCGKKDSEVYFAPTCGFTEWACPLCKSIINLCEYTGVTHEMASNLDVIESLCDSDDLFSTMLEDFNNVFGEKYVKVDDGVYVTQFEVPGFNKSNLTVSLEDGYATISGKRELSQENYVGQNKIFKRFAVGNPKDVKAIVKNGILTLTLKYDVTKLKKIKIDFD